MNIGRLALGALKWIGRIIGIVQTPAGRDVLEAVMGKILGAKAEKYMRRLAKLEAGIGAHTAFWNKMEAGSNGNPEELTPDEYKYILQFKKLWDKNIKGPMDRMAVKLDSPEPTDGELETVTLIGELIGTDDDDDGED